MDVSEPQANWRDDILAQFPDWGAEVGPIRCSEVRARLVVGRPISGEVVARAPFGVWLDIGVGHPALLLVTEMEGTRHRRIDFEDYPAIGDAVDVRVVHFDDLRCKISVSQRAPDD